MSEVGSWHGAALRVALAILHNRENAEEIAQEAAARVIEAGQAVRNPRGYARVIARNLALDRVRRNREFPLDQEERFGRSEADLGEALDRRDLVDRMRALLDEMPPARRSIIEAVYLEERDVNDLIREELAIAPGQPLEGIEVERARLRIHKHMQRGRAWLRRRLAATHGDEP